MENSGIEVVREESHDSYGKRVMRTAFGARYSDMFTNEIHYGAGRPARIDGTLDGDIAVEIESRVLTQVRGVLLDLICRRYPRKLLLLLPLAGHMGDGAIAARQCDFILAKFLTPQAYRVLLLAGCGSAPFFESDVALVRREVENWSSPDQDPATTSPP